MLNMIVFIINCSEAMGDRVVWHFCVHEGCALMLT